MELAQSPLSLSPYGFDVISTTGVDFSSPLPIEVLEMIEKKYCRIEHRTTFRTIAEQYQGTTQWPVHCCSYLVNLLASARDTTHADLHEAWKTSGGVDVSYRGLNAFLKGNPNKRRIWYDLSEGLTRLILLGVGAVSKTLTVNPSSESTRSALRIRDFFFGVNWRPGAIPSFFSPESINATVPANELELTREIDSMRSVCLSGSYDKSKIVIATGNELNLQGETGIKIMEAVECGTAVYIIIPARPRESRSIWRDQCIDELNSLVSRAIDRGVKISRDIDTPKKRMKRSHIGQEDAGRLLLLEVPIDASFTNVDGTERWAFEYLSSPYRFAYFKHRVRPTSEAIRMLIQVRRKNGAGPAVWVTDPSHDETEQFDLWQACFARASFCMRGWLSDDTKRELPKNPDKQDEEGGARKGALPTSQL